MFSLLVQRCTELLRDTPAESIPEEEREDGDEWEEGMVRVSAFPLDLRELLPSVKVWSDWMLGHPDQWNPPPCSIDGCSSGVWRSLADLCNALARVDHGEAPLYKADGDGGEGDEELRLLLLEEDRLLAGFVPLLAAPQEPCYIELTRDTVSLYTIYTLHTCSLCLPHSFPSLSLPLSLLLSLLSPSPLSLA
ncbi:unnamed protein product, partial [Oncorhynchus mykiss]